MLIGYCRTSTVEQVAGLEAQERDLKAAGVERIFAEQTSSVGPRQHLDAALDFIRTGDVLVVTKLDRLRDRSRTCAPSFRGSRTRVLPSGSSR
jgi:DNA invertase Pin-like site-specific DNA recombinase